MQAVQALRVFNKTIRAFSHFPSRGAFFTHLLQKKKLTQTCEFFLLETGVDILSRARVRVIHRALLHCAAKCAARGSPITRRIPFASGKSFRFRTPRFNKNIRTVADFPSADRLLGCPRQYIFIGYKTKSSHNRASFFFWKPASTYSPGHVSASYIALFFAAPQNVRRVARPSRDVFLLRRESLSAPVLRVLIKLSVRSLIFPPQIFAWLSTENHFRRVRSRRT